MKQTSRQTVIVFVLKCTLYNPYLLFTAAPIHIHIIQMCTHIHTIRNRIDNETVEKHDRLHDIETERSKKKKRKK